MYTASSSEMRKLQEKNVLMKSVMDRVHGLDNEIETFKRENEVLKGISYDNGDKQIKDLSEHNQRLLETLRSQKKELRARDSNYSR
jgi:mevalonate kinase